MITEIALLPIKPGQAAAFEQAFSEAQQIISRMKGYLKHELLRCHEEGNKYLLIVEWDTIEDHLTGFRQHKDYIIWKELLHHFYEPFPVVEHYHTVL